MSWISLCFLLLAVLASIINAAPAGQIRIRTSRISRIHVRNGNIKVNGDCNHCDIRTTKNTAQVTSTRNREIIRRF